MRREGRENDKGGEKGENEEECGRMRSRRLRREGRENEEGEKEEGGGRE